MNKKNLRVVQIIATFALLSLVLYQANLFSVAGRADLINTFKGADIRYLVLSVFVGILINLCSAFKWFMITRAGDLGAGFWRIFSYYLVGQFYNLFLPTSVGGDVVRSYELGKYSGRQADSLASVFVERYTGVLTLLLVSSLAVISQLSRFNVQYVWASLLLFAFGLGLIAWMLFDQRLYQSFKSGVGKRIPQTYALFSKLDKLIASLDRYRDQPVTLIWAFVNSLLFYFVAVLNVYVTALVFHADVALLDILIATPIIMLIMNIPLSVGNIGLMEFAYVSVLQLMGYDPALGLSVALLMRLKSFLDAAMGGALYPIFVTQKHE